DTSHIRRETDMRLEADHAGGMDHADHDRLLFRRKARKIGLGADGRKGLAVDHSAVRLESMRHQRPPRRGLVSATIPARVSPRMAGVSRGEPSRTRSNPFAVPTKVNAEGAGCAQPLAQPDT